MGYVALTSGQSVYIAGGAIVHGTFTSDNQSNISISGRGILDGSSFATHSRFLMRFNQVNGLTVEGIILRDSPSWNMPTYHSTNVTVRNIKMLGYRQNSDCLDLISAHTALVEHSFLRCFDDAISVKALDNDDSTDVTVRDTVVWTDWGYGGLDIGAELRSNKIDNVVFQNADVLHSYSSAISINNSEQATVSHVRYEDVRIEDMRRSDFMRLWIGQDVYSQSTERGHIAGVTLRDVRILNGTMRPSEISGFDATHRVEDVSLTNVWALGTRIHTAADAQLTMNGFVSNVTFGP